MKGNMTSTAEQGRTGHQSEGAAGTELAQTRWENVPTDLC